LSDELLTNNEDQNRCFVDRYCTKPTHSNLSKDHFPTLLNEPAGRVATIVTAHIIDLVVHAWEDPSAEVAAVQAQIVEPFFHPSIRNPTSRIQTAMTNVLFHWLTSYPEDEQMDILRRLSSESVRLHHNDRQGISESHWTWGSVLERREGLSENPVHKLTHP